MSKEARGGDLMDRHFVMQSDRHRGWFCGKCGKGITPDIYNAGKHAETCGFSVVDTGEGRNVARDHEPGYRLSAIEGNLHLEICFPELVNIPGFQDRFRGLQWLPVMETVFCPDRRTPLVTGNRSGIDLSLWLSLIRAGKCCRIQHEPDVEVIREVFPGIIGLFSLQMFVHIYYTKGFRHSRLLSEKAARQVLMTAPPEVGSNSLEAPTSSPGQPSRARAGGRGGRPLRASLLRGKGDTWFIRLTVDNGEGRIWPSFLFSRGYAACTPGLDIWQVLQGNYELTADSEGAVRRFAQLYPEYNLEQYLERSSNVLIPLIAPDYHSLLEISAKAAVPAVAENMGELSQFRQDPGLYRNLKDAFRLPLHVLRALDPEDVSDHLMKKLAAVYLCDPGFLQFDRYTEGMLDFYQSLVLPDIQRRYRAAALERELTDKQVLQILRYLRRHSVSWDFLRDYLNACELLEEYPYGFLPRKISLPEAHDRVVQRIELQKGDLERDSFRRIVGSETYLSLTTDHSDEDREVFKEESFVIIPPREKKDLFMESEAMHNCVRIYSPAVVRGSCMIYFLRRKEKPRTSYGTIEVRGNTLVQAKGFANRRLDRPAQDFIRRWCAAKHLDIRTRDIEPTKN